MTTHAWSEVSLQRDAANTLIQRVLTIAPGETVLITHDSGSDPMLSNLIASAVAEAGANPVVIEIGALSHPGAEVPEEVTAASLLADVWIELNEIYVEGTRAHLDAEQRGLRRFYSMAGMTIEDMARLVAVDLDTLATMGKRLADLTTDCHELRVTSPRGCDFRASCEGRIATADTTWMPLGQTHVSPVENSVEGRLVFDGSAFPPISLRILRGSIILDFEGGRVRVASRGHESAVLAKWLSDLRNPDIYRLCHLSYGYHPNVPVPTGRLVNDERVWGCVCIGLGPPMPYAVHCDLTILGPTVEVDGYLIQRDGEYLDEEVRSLARSLHVPGY